MLEDDRVLVLCVLRHGESEHNVAEKNGVETGMQPMYFDPKLTQLGVEQARGSNRPNCNFEEFECWVSPLRRAIMTAVAAVPEVRLWKVVELIREISGAKAADARHTRTEIEKYTKELYGKVAFDFSQLPHGEDPFNNDDYRESAADIYRRVVAALELLLSGDSYNVIWVSHSAFLSCLMAFLHCSSNPAARWLNNGEWRVIDMRVSLLRQFLAFKRTERVPRAVYPLLTLKGTDDGGSLLVRVSEDLILGAEVYTCEALAVIAFGCRVRQRFPQGYGPLPTGPTPVCICGFPVRQKGGCDPAIEAAVKEVEKTIATDEDQQAGGISPMAFQHKGKVEHTHRSDAACKESPGLHVLGESSNRLCKVDGYQRISQLPNGRLHVVKLGTCCSTHILILCFPPSSAAARQDHPPPPTGLPRWCSTTYLADLQHFVIELHSAVCPDSVTVLVPTVP